jgi:HD-GYP domain-containing protein (c-di-GMP phosphodiesterase class II)
MSAIPLRQFSEPRPPVPRERAAARAADLRPVLVATQSAALAGLDELVRERFAATGASQARLRGFGARVAAELGLDRDTQEHIEIATLLRDVGLIGLPDAVLARRRGLTVAEVELVRRHPLVAYDLLGRFPGLEATATFVLCHHERLDGDGYPTGLTALDIPLGARIVGVVDRLEALLRGQPGRPPLPVSLAAERLEEDAPGRFDPDVVGVFASLLR